MVSIRGLRRIPKALFRVIRGLRKQGPERRCAGQAQDRLHEKPSLLRPAFPVGRLSSEPGLDPRPAITK